MFFSERIFFFIFIFFFFNDTATTEIYTLSLHDALPISSAASVVSNVTNAEFGGLLELQQEKHLLLLYQNAFFLSSSAQRPDYIELAPLSSDTITTRSEEHTSELQSHSDLVCRLLLEKKKNNNNNNLVFSFTISQLYSVYQSLHLIQSSF